MLHKTYFGSTSIIFSMWLIISTGPGVLCELKGDFPNPCIVTLCPSGTNCIAFPDNCNPHHPDCEWKAECIPKGTSPSTEGNTSQGPVCGSTGERCQPGEVCKFVQIQCFTTPCPPGRHLACVAA